MTNTLTGTSVMPTAQIELVTRTPNTITIYTVDGNSYEKIYPSDAARDAAYDVLEAAIANPVVLA